MSPTTSVDNEPLRTARGERFLNKAATTAVRKLAHARKLEDALAIVKALVAQHSFSWRPVGDRENNYGSINIGSDPGHAFIERVTNAIDAVIEREALRRLRKSKTPGVPATPREAVETWFTVPGGRIHNVSIAHRQQLADNVVVTLLDSSNKRQPTVEIRDRGIGLTPRLVPLTILSLGAENKINKPYLAGAYVEQCHDEGVVQHLRQPWQGLTTCILGLRLTPRRPRDRAARLGQHSVVAPLVGLPFESAVVGFASIQWRSNAKLNIRETLAGSGGHDRHGLGRAVDMQAGRSWRR